MEEFSTIIQYGFSITIPILIVLRFIITNKRSVIDDYWHFISNYIVFFYLLYLSLNNISTFLKGVSIANNQTEGYNFYYSRTNISSPYGLAYYFTSFGPLILSVLFLLRKKIKNSFVWSLCVILLFYIEPVVIYITSFYRDYLPSSWSIRYDLLPGNDYLFSFLFFNIIIAIILFVQRKLLNK